MTQTNEQFNDFLAREVMGWHIGTVILDFSRDAIECYKDKNDKVFMLIQEWHPTTDIAQAMECAEKSEIQFELFTGWGGWHGSFRKFHEKSQNVRKWYFGMMTLELLPRAICLALYEAVKGGEHDTE